MAINNVKEPAYIVCFAAFYLAVLASVKERLSHPSLDPTV